MDMAYFVVGFWSGFGAACILLAYVLLKIDTWISKS